jgi:hypothetical protein
MLILLMVVFYLVDEGRVADISEVHNASIFRLYMSRMSECSCMYRFLSKRFEGKEWMLHHQGQWERKCTETTCSCAR